jgi:hypothetical protein
VVGCVTHQPILERVGRELKAPKYAKDKAEPAPIVAKKTTAGPLEVAEYVHDLGSATRQQIAKALRISPKTAQRWGAAARKEGWVTVKSGASGGYEAAEKPPADVTVA